VSGDVATCSAAYPTATVPAGPNTITVSYAGTSDYPANSGTGTLTVNQPLTVQIMSSTTLVKLGNGTYQATVTVSNTGSGTATNVVVTSLALGSVSGAPAPQTLGSIAGGSSANAVFIVPASAGAPGAATVIKVSGSYTGGTFGGSTRATLP
jgi:hypothetical protein